VHACIGKEGLQVDRVDLQSIEVLEDAELLGLTRLLWLVVFNIGRIKKNAVEDWHIVVPITKLLIRSFYTWGTFFILVFVAATTSLGRYLDG
jgi:hypothetical protein